MTIRNQFYFPASESASIVWLIHLAIKLALCGEQLGLFSEEIREYSPVQKITVPTKKIMLLNAQNLGHNTSAFAGL
jgi:hypothetical protein